MGFHQDTLRMTPVLPCKCSAHQYYILTPANPYNYRDMLSCEILTASHCVFQTILRKWLLKEELPKKCSVDCVTQPQAIFN